MQPLLTFSLYCLILALAAVLSWQSGYDSGWSVLDAARPEHEIPPGA